MDGKEQAGERLAKMLGALIELGGGVVPGGNDLRGFLEVLSYRHTELALRASLAALIGYKDVGEEPPGSMRGSMQAMLAAQLALAKLSPEDQAVIQKDRQEAADRLDTLCKSMLEKAPSLPDMARDVATMVAFYQIEVIHLKNRDAGKPCDCRACAGKVEPDEPAKHSEDDAPEPVCNCEFCQKERSAKAN